MCVDHGLGDGETQASAATFSFGNERLKDFRQQFGANSVSSVAEFESCLRLNLAHREAQNILLADFHRFARVLDQIAEDAKHPVPIDPDRSLEVDLNLDVATSATLGEIGLELSHKIRDVDGFQLQLRFASRIVDQLAGHGRHAIDGLLDVSG